MKILHYYPSDQQLIADYVDVLCSNKCVDVDQDKATTADEARQSLAVRHYDVLHLHGCWRNSIFHIVRQALKARTRIVVTPYGQLEPWVRKDGYWKEKLPKQLLYQKTVISRAYAVVVQGKMEEACMQQLGWNPRTVIIRNSLITHTTNDLEMARENRRLYRRVMDSNTLELMTEETKTTLRQIIKAGITNDARWLREPCIRINDSEQWRMLLCHAYQEQVLDIVQRGIRTLQLDAPELDMNRTECFMPAGYEPSQSIESVIGMEFASENERLLATFRQVRKLVSTRRLTLAHLIELDRELRYHDAEEKALCDALEERGLLVVTARTMQLCGDLTGMDEGFMPVSPLNDRHTRSIRKQIDNHLKI